MTILITSCSSTRVVTEKVRVGQMPTGLSMRGALDWWTRRLTEEGADITPRELYRGLGFSTLVKIQDQFELAGVKIITGGQGLIDIDEKIVSYDFTAHPKEPENIHQKVTAEPFVQTVWWRMINEARGKGPNPIAQLVKDNQGEYVVISASKIFLRYCSDDILSIPINERNNIRILLTASSLGSVPRQLRPMIIPFDRSAISDLPGNRNDNNHRAAQRFLELIEDHEFASKNVLDQQRTLDSSESAFSGGMKQSEKVDVETFLRERPHYMTMPIEDAYKLTQRALGTIGGRMYFRSLVRQMRGSTITSTEEEVKDAVEALQGLGVDFLENGSEPHLNEEEEALKGVQIFIDAIKQFAPKAMFAAADICQWAPVYYGKKKEPIPSLMESPNKLSFILKNNTTILELVSTGKGYIIAQPGRAKIL